MEHSVCKLLLSNWADCREILRGEHSWKFIEKSQIWLKWALHKDLIVPHIIVNDIRVYITATKTTHCCFSMATVVIRTLNSIALYVHCISFFFLLYVTRAYYTLTSPLISMSFIRFDSVTYQDDNWYLLLCCVCRVPRVFHCVFSGPPRSGSGAPQLSRTWLSVAEWLGRGLKGLIGTVDI